jgi:16S rRNA (guanine966-N2)-methyltransferase
MRIIAGEFRGRRIEQPPLDKARPTKDRVRESVFNMIAPEIAGSMVLDLFSGSGAYGLEALSRGARDCVFVENCPECVDVITRNIEALSLGSRSCVLMSDAREYIEGGLPKESGFDLIFSDPPYCQHISKNILIKINHYDILNDSGTLVLEHSSNEDIPGRCGNVSIYKQKTYRDIAISVFQKK